MLKFFLIILAVNKGSLAVDPLRHETSKEGLARYYFQAGYSYQEIITFMLLYHGISVSVRHLHRLLRKNQLFRRFNHTSVNNVIMEVRKILEGSGSNFGYRALHQKLRLNGIITNREIVRFIVKTLDPEGVQLRTAHRLKRRLFISPGPNYTWHIDGYDKLKPYGFPIHAAIDGYSRKILWLNITHSNNDPNIVASYFINCIEELRVLPTVVRADRGSENIVIGGIQAFLRENHDDNLSGERSFRYGSSVTNQRIESWWSYFRKHRSDWWINLFKDFCDEGIYEPSVAYQKTCMFFSFHGILQSELDDVKRMWNNHTIRNSREAETPGGKPDVLFYAPDLTGGENRQKELDMRTFAIVKEMYGDVQDVPYTVEFLRFAALIMNEKNVNVPSTVAEAKALYFYLVEEIERYA